MSVNRGMDKEAVLHVYHGMLISHWKEWNNAICSNTDVEIVILSEVRERGISWHPFYVESKKKWYKWTYLQNSNRLTDLEQKLTAAIGEERWEGIGSEFERDMYTLRYLKWITNKDLLCITGNSAQCYVAAWMGGEFGGEWMHVYV